MIKGLQPDFAQFRLSNAFLLSSVSLALPRWPRTLLF